MTEVEVVLLVQRLRRNFPRHPDVLAICTWAEQRVTEPPVIKEIIKEVVREVEPIKVTGHEPDRLRAPRGTFDRKNYKRIYQREWLRRKRARDGLGTGGE